jgi:hypothetical protein
VQLIKLGRAEIHHFGHLPHLKTLIQKKVPNGYLNYQITNGIRKKVYLHVKIVQNVENINI